MREMNYISPLPLPLPLPPPSLPCCRHDLLLQNAELLEISYLMLLEQQPASGISEPREQAQVGAEEQGMVVGGGGHDWGGGCGRR